MPNTPAQIGEGITVWTATEAVGAAQREEARQILGRSARRSSQKTKISSTWPPLHLELGRAYVFLFMEAMADAGVHLGFPRRIAEQLVVQTVRGSVTYYNASPRHLARLRNEVTSPAGTTASALYYLEQAGFRTAIVRAIWAAYERFVELEVGKNVPRYRKGKSHGGPDPFDFAAPQAP